MANHCIDVICAGCGRVFCVRGCGTDFKADKTYLEEWLTSKPVEKRYEMVKAGDSYNDCCSGYPCYSWSCGDVK